MCEWKSKSDAQLIDGKRYLITMKYPNWQKPEIHIAEYHPGGLWLVEKYGWQSDAYVFSVADLPAPAPISPIARIGFLHPFGKPWPYSTKTGGG